MLHIEGLRKTYGALVAVDGLSMEARPGEILALLGPNGAGKSTTIQCLVGLLTPDAGRIEVDGLDLVRDRREVRRRIGYVPETARVHEVLTPVEYLALKGRLFGMAEDRIADGTERLLTGFGLGERGGDPMVGFSKGMLQKVSLAAALLVEPRLLVLDEPLSGLDVESTMLVKELLRQFADAGHTVLYCSHLLDVVESLADRVAVLDRGKLQAQGTMAELHERSGREGEKLEAVFARLTQAADPGVRARAILGGEG